MKPASRVRSRAATGLAAGTMAFLAACDGYIAVNGQVYARAAGDTLPSVAVVDGKPPAIDGLTPLDGALIWVFHDPRDTAVANPDTLLWVDEDTSAADGSFHTGSTTCPCRFTALLRVRREGYQGVDVAFPHDSLRHRAVVVLTPLAQGRTRER